MVRKRTRIRRWLAEHYLHLSKFQPGPRRLFLLCFGVGGAAAATMILASLTGVRLYRPVCPTRTESVLALVGSGIALTSLALGLAMLALAGQYAPSRFPRTRFLLLLVVPLLLLVTVVVSAGALGTGEAAAVLSPLRVVLLFVPLQMVLVVVAGTSARGPAGVGATIALVATGFAGFVGYVTASLPMLNACQAGAVVAGGLAMLSFLALLVVPVLLVWLAAEGLLLSGRLANWALAWAPERWLLRVLLSVKLLGLAVAAGLVMTGYAPRWLAELAPDRAAAWLVALLLVALIWGLLTFETRLVSASISDFTLVTRGFTFLVGAALLAVPLLGLVFLLSALPGRPKLLLALPVCVIAGIVSGLLNRRPKALTVAVSAALLAASLGLLLWALLTSPPGVIGDFAAIMNTTALGLLLGGFLVAGLLVLVGLLVARPALRRPITFLVALTLWVVLTLALPSLGVTPVAVDIVLTLAIAVLAVAGRLGWQRGVSAYELVLLLVTGTVIVEGPLILGALPELFRAPLLIIAFLAPALVAVTLDAPPLNAEPSDRPLRCYLTLGVLCVGYGLLSGLVLVVDQPLPLVRGMVELFNGVAALPFAVMLIAVMSASRQRSAATAT